MEAPHQNQNQNQNPKSQPQVCNVDNINVHPSTRWQAYHNFKITQFLSMTV